MARILSKPLLDESQTAKLLGISPRTLQRWRRIGEGPVFVRVGGSVRYPEIGLERFAQSGLRIPRSAIVGPREHRR